jgi:hypothetical protein
MLASDTPAMGTTSNAGQETIEPLLGLPTFLFSR